MLVEEPAEPRRRHVVGVEPAVGLPPRVEVLRAGHLGDRRERLRAPVERGDRVHVELDAPQTAVAPGQAVVFYDGDVVVGGGWIA